MFGAPKVVLLLLLQQLCASNAQAAPPVVWSDEFDMDVLKPDVWNVHEGPHPDNVMAVYEKAQVNVGMGSLNMFALPRVGAVSSTSKVDSEARFWFKYGMVTFRAWMPGTETGTVPCLSLIGQDTEIRVTMPSNQQVESSLHYLVGREMMVET